MDADMPAVVERWTPETEELVREHAGVPQVDAAAVLAALADAGLLLPPGGETREEWGVQHPTLDVDGPVIHFQGDHEGLARRMVTAAGNLTLVRRRFHETPWMEVRDA